VPSTAPSAQAVRDILTTAALRREIDPLADDEARMLLGRRLG
jgi:hypothetical protein